MSFLGLLVITKNAAIFILPMGLLSLVFGILAGWVRLGLRLPVSNLVADHGALMTGGFIGTLICLERSIVHPNKWWRLLPFISGLSFFLFQFKFPILAYWLLLIASMGLVILMITYLRYALRISQFILILGALAWLIGNLNLIDSHFYPSAVKWWMLFLICTIFGERLELSGILPMTQFKRVSLYFVLLLMLAGALFPFHWYGNEILAISMIAIAIWLYLFDMSRYSIKKKGQQRYSALLLMVGYLWLIVTASWLLFWPNAAYAYDASLHSLFIGFVFSMIFAHIPIIFPGIFKMNISLYHPLLYVLFFIFQTSLIVRIVGDALLNSEFRKWGAVINGITILSFLIATALIILFRLKKKKTYVPIRRKSEGILATSV